MKTIFRAFAAIGIAALFATSCDEGAIDNLQKQIDQLKTGEIASISKQVEAINTSINELTVVDVAMKNYISALQKDGETYKAQIAELTAMDGALEGRIAELKTYVDEGIKNTRDWASATFATLEQLDALSEVVAALPSRIDEVAGKLDDAKKAVTAAYQKAIAESFAKLETSMKAWVNEKLTGYYTIAQVDARLDSLAKAHDQAAAALKDQLDGQKQYADSLAGAHDQADSLIQKQIDEQKAALAKTREELTAAYKAAIKDAIDNYDGKVEERVAEAIATATADLEGKLDAINGEIESIKGRLGRAEASIQVLVNMIQSITVIPSYTDGSVQYTDNGDTLVFDIKPVSAAKELARLWNSSSASVRASMLSFAIRDVKTKNGEAPSAKINTVFFKDGEFNVGVKFAGLSDYAMASLQVKSGANEKSSDYFALIPPFIHVTGVSLDCKALEIAAGKDSTLTAIITPDNATDKSVTWQSLNEGVASVDTTGKVSAIKAGKTRIVVTTVDRAFTDTCDVEVYTPVTGVALDTASLTLAVDSTYTLIPTITPKDAKYKGVTWNSIDSAIAEVDANGKVKAKTVGSTKVIVTTVDGAFKDTCNVTVYIPVTGVALDTTALTLPVGAKFKINAIITPANATNKNVTWKSSEGNIAEVDKDGNVTAVSAGQTEITVTTEDGEFSATCKVTVVVPVTGVSLDKKEHKLLVGQTFTLEATVNPSDATNKNISWSSNAAGIAEVDKVGKVTAKAVGIAVITVTTEDGKFTATCAVTVNPVTGGTEEIGRGEQDW